MEKSQDPQLQLQLQGHRQQPATLLDRVANVLGLIWAFSESDFGTFVLPNTAFGIFGALSGTRLAEGILPSSFEILLKLPLALAFNWYSVLLFELANQRTPESVKEDSINKPWRPIPSGRVEPDQVRKAMLLLIPLSWAANYSLGVWTEGLMIQVLTWAYNDLGGGDEIIRDAVIAVAYGFFNLASLKIALGQQAGVAWGGYVWICVISGVILTTMQVQDLKDQEGDETRGRKTIPLVFGDQFSRVTIAVFVCIWSGAGVVFWGMSWIKYAVTGAAGALVVARVLTKKGVSADRATWKAWCLWTVSLYCLPLLTNLTEQWWL